MAETRFFGTDGIRAEFGTFPLVPDFVLKLGLAAGDVLRQGRPGGEIVVVGRDTRRSGSILQSALTSGLLATGVSVLDVGVITTPGVAYLVRRLGAVAGVVISASHNPVKENGIKFFGADGFKLPESVELDIERRLDADYRRAYSHESGRSIDGHGMHEFYIEDLVSEHPDLRLDGLKLVMDCANGAASYLAPECFSRLGAAVTVINASPTGLNINDHAGSEFVRRQPEMLARLAQQYGANFGLAFDGDADRVIFVDEHGEIVDGDHMIAILADYFEK
ncbi:MAG: phosphoglucosamine mutase, partial [Rudaea sp.]